MLLKDKKILISTNLTPTDIKREYEESPICYNIDTT